MVWPVLLGSMFVATVTLVVLELRRAAAHPAPAPAEGGRARGAVLAFAAAACGSVFTPAWFFFLERFGRPLPVERPASPASGEPWNLDLELGTALLLTAAGLVVVVRLVPVVVAWFVGRRPRAAALLLPSGRRFSQVAGGIAGAVAVLAAARVALGGFQPVDFGTHGALTPDAGASGWRLDLVLVEALVEDAELRPLAAGSPLASELEWDEGNDCCGALALMPGWHEVRGLKAWVGGLPVLIEAPPGGTPRWRRVVERHEEDFPRARRPSFESVPRWAPAAGGGIVLVETRGDGRRFVVRADAVGSTPAAFHDVGWLLAAPVAPLVVLLLAMLAAFVLARRAAAGSVHAAPLRFAAAWLLLEAAAGTVVLYLPYV